MKTNSLHYLDTGSGDPILWIHGYPLSSEVFRQQLSIPRYRHVVPDLPGFGNSPALSSPLQIQDYATESLRLLDHLGIRRAVVAGLSMGGYVAFAIARESLSRVAALILIDTRELADTAEGRQKRSEAIVAVQQHGISAVVKEMMPKLLSGNASPELRQRVEGVVRRASPDGVMAALQAMAGRPDSTDLLPKLKVPALVVVGSEDAVTPVADAERMVKALPDGRLRVIRGAGHLSNVEKAQEFNQLVTEFLAEIGY